MLLQNRLIKFFTLVTVLLVGYLGSIVISGVAYEHWTKKISEETIELQNNYTQEVLTKTDPYRLVKLGVRQANFGETALALISLQRAVEIDPNYRDGWVYLGYVQIKSNRLGAALESLQKAAELDPINPLTYQLLNEAYKKTGNQEMARQAEEKYQMLSKISN